MNITQFQLETLSDLMKTVSGHKPQCFLSEVIENTNSDDYKQFDGIKTMEKYLKEIKLLTKMFDDMDMIVEKRKLRVEEILSKQYITV